MNESLIAARYAKALLLTGIEARNLPHLCEDLRLIGSACRAEPRIMQILNSPSVQRETKLQLLEKMFGEKVTPYTMRFAGTLLQRNRQQLLPDILRSFERLYNEHENIRQAVLTTASPVDEAQRQAVVLATGKKNAAQTFNEEIEYHRNRLRQLLAMEKEAAGQPV